MFHRCSQHLVGMDPIAPDPGVQGRRDEDHFGPCGDVPDARKRQVAAVGEQRNFGLDAQRTEEI